MLRLFERASCYARRVIFAWRFPVSPALQRQLDEVAQACPSPRGGGSSAEKRRVMASLIVRHRLRRSVEIGVFAGSSLFAQALAMRFTGGVALGIDPWSPQAAEQRENLERIHADLPENWHHVMDWEALHQSVIECLRRHGLSAHCRLIPQRSQDAIELLQRDAEPVDFLHIDGNHDREQCTADIEGYLPMVRRGGFVVIDDVAWESIWPLYCALRARHAVVYEAHRAGEVRPSWAVLRVR